MACKRDSICSCPDCRKLYCGPEKSVIEPTDFTGLLKTLWDRIEGDFADKRSVIELLLEVQKLQELNPVRHLMVNQDRLDPDSKGVVTLEFEDWIQADETRANGTNNEVHRVYNSSKNAVSAFAVAELAKKIDKKLNSLNQFRTEFVQEVDGHGFPLIVDPSYSVLYILCERGPKGMHFSEWLYLPINGGQWERVGDNLDLKDVNKRLDNLYECHQELNDRLTTHSTKLYEMYKKQQEVLEGLLNMFESPDFILKLVNKIPRASLQLPGLMTPSHLQLLEQLRLDSCGAKEGVIRANIWMDATGKPGKASGIVKWSVLDGPNDVPQDQYEVLGSINDQLVDLKQNPLVELDETSTFTVRIMKDGEQLVERTLTVTKVDPIDLSDINEITNPDIDKILKEIEG